MDTDKKNILPAEEPDKPGADDEEGDENIGKITSDFFANTSAHGLPRIIISKSTFRWVLL